MMRSVWVIAGWWLVSVAGVLAAVPKAGLDGVIAELLDWRAPAPDWGEQIRNRMKEGWKSPRVSAPKPPAEDASIEALAEYWSGDRWGSTGRPAQPGRVVVERLLKHCEERPEVLKGFVNLFDGKNADTVSRLRRLHDGMRTETEMLKEAKEALHKWLVLRTGEFADELARVARQSLNDPSDEDKELYLEKFFQRDPKGAEAMLKQAAKESAGAVRAVALQRLFEHRLEQGGMVVEDAELREWRVAMQRAVESKEAAGLRAELLKTLVKAEWQGKTEWIMTLFADATLGEDQEAGYPLARIAGSDPDFWIPRIVPLVNNANRTVHNNAVRCLVAFHLEDSRADALRPLLPWLSNPNWAEVDDEYARLRIIQSVDRLDLPECIPGLLWVVEHDEDACLEYVAEPLIHYRVTQAIPALKRALPKRQRFTAKAIVALGGLTRDEMVDAALARLRRRAPMPMPSPFGDEGAASDKEVLGAEVLSSKTDDEDLAAALLRKAGELNRREPMASGRIESWLAGTPTRAGVESADRILREGRFTSNWLLAVVGNRDYLGKRLAAGPELGAPARAIRAFLAGDQAEVAAVFGSKDQEVPALLCALARLERQPLPLQRVGALMRTPNELHARAAEQYLLTEDSAEARALVWAQHAGKAAIVGARTPYDPGHHTFGQFAELEERLRERLLDADGPAEIHALLSSGYWGDNGQIIIESRPNQHLLIQEQGMGRRAVRELSAEEWGAWEKVLAGSRIEELGPYDMGADDGIQYEYVRVSRTGGVRVFMNNPPNPFDVLRAMQEGISPDPNEPTGDVYGHLVEHLRALTRDKEGFRITYSASAKVPGLQIVVRNEQAGIEAVASHAGRVAVLTRYAGQERSAWRRVTDGKLAEEVKGEDPLVPSGWKKDFDFQEHLVNARWQAGFGKAAVVPARRKSDEKDGLWMFEEGLQPRLLAEGVFANPITTPDGKWVVAAKQTGNSWASPNGVVRVRIADGKMIPLDLQPCDTFHPIAWVQPRERVLIYLSRDPEVPGVQPDAGPAKPQYRLLDAATGESNLVTGEFGPLEQALPRPLQAVKGDPNVVWAAMPVMERGVTAGTRICHYDVKNFRLKTLLELPEVYFETGGMWVDEASKVIYAVVNQDLIRFPMPE